MSRLPSFPHFNLLSTKALCIAICPSLLLSPSLSLSKTINAIDSRCYGQHFYRPHGKQPNYRCKSFRHDQEQRWWTGTFVRKRSTGTSPRGDLEPDFFTAKFLCHEPRRIHHLQPVPVQVRLQSCGSASGGEVLEQLSGEPIRNEQPIFIVKHPLSPICYPLNLPFEKKPSSYLNLALHIWFGEVFSPRPILHDFTLPYPGFFDCTFGAGAFFLFGTNESCSDFFEIARAPGCNFSWLSWYDFDIRIRNPHWSINPPWMELLIRLLWWLLFFQKIWNFAFASPPLHPTSRAPLPALACADSP